MIYLLAILLPFAALWGAGKPFQGIFCLILQITLIGWIPAMIWAILVVNNDKNEKRHKQLVDAAMGKDPFAPKPRPRLSSDYRGRAHELAEIEAQKTAQPPPDA